MTEIINQSVAVDLAIATGCVHCAAVLEAISRKLKAGTLGRARIVNIAVDTEFATEHGIRSVPWLRIGSFEFDGAMTPGEIDQWIGHAASDDGIRHYLDELLGTGELARAGLAGQPY